MNIPFFCLINRSARTAAADNKFTDVNATHLQSLLMSLVSIYSAIATELQQGFSKRRADRRRNQPACGAGHIHGFKRRLDRLGKC
ncbi:hypothetical protein [Rhizobium lentis]|uniref:Uncharacterized protein n=1 Tax=Rhizobium lentis TaxID=1138194 RepID=A0A7W8UPB8_9HYPH|nr:hypothetical protein [Rhizobium lentis]MBB5551184.1 hypothetical protein [Rhizobium lentis]MBB5561721.1 hypothetical protein [Rhizobium lentis]MBB5568305.1 hypothetical protein [Rhizobium lentis]